MALPKLNTQTFELNVPSTDEKIKYRPFLVKEEKILLQAQEGEQKEMFNALSDVVRACTFDKVDIERLPSFDVEYMFLKIRAKSVGEKVKLNLAFPTDEIAENVNIDTNDFESIKNFIIDNRVDLVVVGPEQPLVGGLVGLGFATIIGSFSTRKAGTVFAMISLGIGELIAACCIIITVFFGGEEGISGDRTMAPPTFGIEFITQKEVYFLIAFYY